jgi:GTP-binding protein HflX
VKEADLILHVVDMSNQDYFSHEKTVNKLLEDMGVEQIPQITVYNKRDAAHPDFVPTAKTETAFISAFEEEDRAVLKLKMEQSIIEMMEPFHVLVPSGEGKLLSQLKNETILRELSFDEEKQGYICRGYALSDHQVSGQLKKYNI